MAQEKAAWWLQYLINEDLYIVEEKTPAAPTDGTQIPEAPTPAETVGEDGQSHGVMREVLIAYTRQHDRDADAQDRKLLANILKAIRKNPADVHMLAVEGNNAVIDETHLQQMPHTIAILFGADIQYHVHRNTRLYAIEKHGDHTLLQVDDLQTLAGFKLKKKALWNALQTLFKI